MPYGVRIQTEVREPVAIAAAYLRLPLPEPETSTFTHFSASATGVAVCMPRWMYPIVCAIDFGTLALGDCGVEGPPPGV